MSKTFVADGTGSGQTLSELESDKIPIYDSMADVTADLANLTAGQIVATKDTGDELSQPVDVVEEDNLHAVSSNAVFENCPRFPDYANRITIASGTTSWTATEDCYVMIQQTSTVVIPIVKIDNKEVGVSDNSSGYYVMYFAGYVKKGQTIAYTYLYNSTMAKIFKLI